MTLNHLVSVVEFSDAISKCKVYFEINFPNPEHLLLDGDLFK